jgi:glycosyltransferase involved in cell wall biosynthesis
MKIAFVHNFASHYTVKTYEILSKYYDLEYYFFSGGDEWYWMEQHGVRTGNFNFKYLPGFRLKGTRITPTLPVCLLFGKYAVYIKCINGRFALPATYLIAKLKFKPFILWTGIWARIETPFHRMIFPLTKFIYRHADAVVVYGNHVKRYLISEGVSAEKIFVAAHAVDNELYSRVVSEEEKAALRDQMGIHAREKVILYTGRLEAVKGLEYLIEAFASLRKKDAVLVIVGDGSEKTRLQEIVRARGLEDVVRFPGYVAVEKTVAYYSLAWVYVLPSVARPEGKELWGLVVNEAFNQGIPVVATEAVGAAVGGLIEQNVSGYIVPERNSNALRDALQAILCDEQLRNRLSENARQRIATWDQENMVLGFRKAIEYVTRNHRGAS